MDLDLRTWARRRGVRATAMAVLVLGPIAAVPIVSATGATAADVNGPTAAQQGAQAAYPGAVQRAAASSSGPATCTKYDYFTTSVDAATGTAVFGSTNSACNGQTVSVVSYKTSGSTASYDPPQQRFAIKTLTATVAGSPYTVHVAVPGCFDQLDVILGSDAPSQLTGPYFFQHDTLIGHDNGGTTGCTTTTTSAPPCTPPATGTPPACTTTSTPPCTPPATGTPPSCTTTSTPPCTPPATGTPPACTTSTEPTSPTTSATTSSSTPPTTHDGPSSSTAVLPFSTSRPPVLYVPTQTLPNTGVEVPVRAGLLAALALLMGGAGLVLLAGSGSPAGAYRRR